MSIYSFLLASESSGFGINTDILETNVINIAILLGLLVYAGKGVLGKILSARLESIESAIKDADQRKQKAIEQLSDQQEKLAKAQAECDRLIAAAEADAKVASSAILADIDAEIARLRATAATEIATDQERVVIQLRQQLAEKALSQVNAYFERGLSDSVQHQLVDRSIELLGAK